MWKETALIGEVATTTAAVHVPAPDGETCTFVTTQALGTTGNTSYCYVYRSCGSCLAIDGCAINDRGICVNATEGRVDLSSGMYIHDGRYNASRSYHHAIKSGLVVLNGSNSSGVWQSQIKQDWHFLSGEATYCKASDPSCDECKRRNFWRASNSTRDSRFCVGENDCVCIQTCESQVYEPLPCVYSITMGKPQSYGQGCETMGCKINLGKIGACIVAVGIGYLLFKCFLNAYRAIDYRRRILDKIKKQKTQPESAVKVAPFLAQTPFVGTQSPRSRTPTTGVGSV